jgi:hypothetical protein
MWSWAITHYEFVEFHPQTRYFRISGDEVHSNRSQYKTRNIEEISHKN